MTHVKIVAITAPVEALTPEQFVAHCARVSNPANQNNHATAPKLMRYLADNAHWSPFEMVSITMLVETTRDIARQLLRHRSFSFQEFSQRYADAREMGFAFRDARMQDTKNRQASLDCTDPAVAEEWQARQEQALDAARTAYDWALAAGIAKEQARAVLPEGMTISRLYVAGTLRSWIHYCQLRTDNGTQREHQDVATAARDALMAWFPSLRGVLCTSIT